MPDDPPDALLQLAFLGVHRECASGRAEFPAEPSLRGTSGEEPERGTEPVVGQHHRQPVAALPGRDRDDIPGRGLGDPFCRCGNGKLANFRAVDVGELDLPGLHGQQQSRGKLWCVDRCAARRAQLFGERAEMLPGILENRVIELPDPGRRGALVPLVALQPGLERDRRGDRTVHRRTVRRDGPAEDFQEFGQAGRSAEFRGELGRDFGQSGGGLVAGIVVHQSFPPVASCAGRGFRG